MNKRRLLKLADLLEADAKNKKGMRFDLNIVGFSYDVEETGAVRLDCSTAACAMGLASLSGAFKRAGLSYVYTGGWLNNISTTINGRKVMYDRAAMRIFGISLRQADFLFTPSFYPDDKLTGAIGERFVAKRIRDFVAGKVAA